MIGLIVDGPGDYASFKARFDNLKVLKADGPRGHTVTPKVIVGAAKKQIKMLTDYGCSAIGLITDLENRSINHSHFIGDLTREIELSVFSTPVFVAAPNQMIENWYLADIEKLSSSKVYIRDNLRQKRFEGTNGKKELKKLFKSNFSYNEIKHGAELFRLIRLTRAISNSESFEFFMKKFRKYK